MKSRRFLICILCAVFALLCFSGCSNGESEYIAIVQNGYLGEYTDITVQELLSGHYGIMYEEEIWDGGTTDSGKEIVEVKFQNPDDDESVAIQFTVMDEKFFKVSAFVDPWEEIEKETDLFAVLNYIYIEQYALRNQKGIGNSEFELDFIEQLDQISGSAVLYGASADYSGSRGELCALYGEQSLDLSVPWLLDNYGLLDMGYYYGTSIGDDIYIDTDLYSVILPADWAGRYICEQWETSFYGYALDFYEQQSYYDYDGYGGLLFSLILYPSNSEIEYPNYSVLGELDVVRLASYSVLVAYPTDIQFSDAGMNDYVDMSDDIEGILSTFTVQPGVDGTFIPAFN